MLASFIAAVQQAVVLSSFLLNDSEPIIVADCLAAFLKTGETSFEITH
jgi:hypothetical protein